MRVLIAPDKFKGSLSAPEVTAHLAAGLAECGVETVSLPLADGGDGSVDAALSAGYSRVPCVVRDAVGRSREAAFARSADTAVVEIAGTCGLATVADAGLAPMDASSHGLGDAVRQAVTHGARTVVLALGGSASTDGGTGMLAALGFRFRDEDGATVEAGAGRLAGIHTLDAGHAVDLSGIDLVVATDVTNPLTGPTGAAAVFGPQKGATAAQIETLDHGLRRLIGAAAQSGWRDAAALAGMPGAGAAGGCGFAAALLGARLVSGADHFLDLLQFDRHLSGADLVITGEGRLDDQTLAGKLPAAVLRRSAPTPVVAVVGRDQLRTERDRFASIHALTHLTDADTSSDRHRSAQLLREIGGRIARSLPAAPHF